MLSNKKFLKNVDGAALVEFTLIMPILFLITFSVVEFSLVYNKFNSAQKATQLGARVAATRLVLEGVTDCGVTTNEPAGTDCINVAGSSGWSVSCTGAGGGGCNATGMAAVLSTIQVYYPEVEANDVQIEFEGTGLGFVGRGRPVPAITVSINNITYDYIVVGNLLRVLDPSSTFAQTLNIASAKTTIIGEDIGEGNS